MQTTQTETITEIVDNEPIFDQTTIPANSLVVSVIVPAQNEAQNIVETLDALRLQTDLAGLPFNQQLYEVLLLANNCTDETFRIAKQYQQQYPDFQLHIAEVFLLSEKANIGYVRRVLMDEAYRRLMLNTDCNGIIASTDGDTHVDKCWIAQIINEINKGCEAVGGRILTQSTNCSSRLYYLRDVAYRNLLARAEAIIDPESHDPWPRHFQYFGANMAVTCAAYHQVGRLPQVPHLEDNAFHEALQRMDIRIRKSPAVKAYTSTRLNGRVDIGFSEQLKKWSDYEKLGFVQEVEPVEAKLTKLRCRFMLKQCRKAYFADGFYDQSVLNKVADALFINQKWLSQELKTSKFFGQFWENVKLESDGHTYNSNQNLVNISLAIKQLRLFVYSQDLTFFK